MDKDNVRAAAERLLNGVALEYPDDTESLLGFEADILTVARFALAAEPRPEGGEPEQSCTVEGCTVPPGMLH